jgi:hypothetical protein
MCKPPVLLVVLIAAAGQGRQPSVAFLFYMSDNDILLIEKRLDTHCIGAFFMVPLRGIEPLFSA